MKYDLLELTGVSPETVVQVLCNGDDEAELEFVRDQLTAESLGVKGPGSMRLQDLRLMSERRFAVRPAAPAVTDFTGVKK